MKARFFNVLDLQEHHEEPSNIVSVSFEDLDKMMMIATREDDAHRGWRRQPHRLIASPFAFVVEAESNPDRGNRPDLSSIPRTLLRGCFQRNRGRSPEE